jgi:ABC-type branched-subunit amino acid transport system substrate-binding protein
MLAPIVVLGLLVTGAGTASASAPATATGVTNNQIDLGVTYVDLEAIKDVVNGLNHGDYEKSFRAVIDDLNKKGGINGRKVVPTFAPINPIGTAPAQEACLKLTEDKKVFATVGFFLNDGPLCYVEQHKMPVIGGTITKDYLARAKAPWFTLDPGDEVTSKAIDAFAADGAFKGQKVGMVSLAQEKGILDGVVLPALKRNNVKATSAVIDAPTSDVVAGQQQADAIVERFKTDKITTVLAVSSAVVGIGQALAKTNYRPRLVATHDSPYEAYVRQKDSDPTVLRNSISANTGVEFNDPALQKCFGVVEQVTGNKIVEQAAEGQPEYRVSAQTACRDIALFAALGKAAGKNLTVESFGKAINKLGPVEIPGSGTITYDPKTHSFKQPIFIYRYDPATKLTAQDEKPLA